MCVCVLFEKKRKKEKETLYIYIYIYIYKREKVRKRHMVFGQVIFFPLLKDLEKFFSHFLRI